MVITLNQHIGGRLEELALLLEQQGANRFRVQAYRRAAATVRALAESVHGVYAREGLTGLEKLPDVGPTIDRAIRDLLTHGRLAMLDRLRGECDPVRLLRSVPGIGHTLARTLHDELGITTLAELEAAAHDGRLLQFGVGPKRLAWIRDSLAHRLGRLRAAVSGLDSFAAPVSELLDVDHEYRQAAASGTLKKIAPRRFNRTGDAWLPVLHTSRGSRHYTALFSNTARAHELRKTHDWVVIYDDGGDDGFTATVVTASLGALKGLRVVRGRESECEALYRAAGSLPAKEAATRAEVLSLS